jgi:hypothetical protein
MKDDLISRRAFLRLRGAGAAAPGGPEKPRPVGGDEVALAHAAYVGVHADRRLFVHDAGNGRIVGVKLGYHAAETVPLKQIQEGKAGE